ncbi:MAG: UDP-N-acetylglucosamine 2-epimerase [Halocynthiibacter sp.]
MKLHYVSGSRADFGLMEKCLKHLHAQPDMEIACVLTGQHVNEKYAAGREDILASGLNIACEVPVTLTGQDGAEMGAALAHELLGFLTAWQHDRPDLILVLGDRGEMLAAALAAVHLGIPVGHIHGGERSGTLDESFRHAISKLAHVHFPATDEAHERLIRMGEQPDNIWTIGAPGLVGLTEGVKHSPALADTHNLTATGASVIVVFHPVVQEAAQAGAQIQILLGFLSETSCHGIILRPNSDAGGAEIDAALQKFSSNPNTSDRFAILEHLPRDRYLESLKAADIMIGNSSSGIIESASFDLACLNLGTRQNNRLRNDNTVDCPTLSPEKIKASYNAAITMKGPFVNLYGDGKTDRRLVKILQELTLDPSILAKCNSY